MSQVSAPTTPTTLEVSAPIGSAVIPLPESLHWTTKSGKDRAAHSETGKVFAPRAIRISDAQIQDVQRLNHGRYWPVLRDLQDAMGKAGSEWLARSVRDSLAVEVDGVMMAPAGDPLTADRVNKRTATAVALCLEQYAAGNAYRTTKLGPKVLKPSSRALALCEVFSQWLAGHTATE